MGGQETLLLVARYPHLLAGAAAFDPVVDFALQYRDFPRLACSSRLPEDVERADRQEPADARAGRARRVARAGRATRTSCEAR